MIIRAIVPGRMMTVTRGVRCACARLAVYEHDLVEHDHSHAHDGGPCVPIPHTSGRFGRKPHPSHKLARAAVSPSIANRLSNRGLPQWSSFT
jgi:hypothetical protein